MGSGSDESGEYPGTGIILFRYQVATDLFGSFNRINCKQITCLWLSKKTRTLIHQFMNLKCYCKKASEPFKTPL